MFQSSLLVGSYFVFRIRNQSVEIVEIKFVKTIKSQVRTPSRLRMLTPK